MPGTGHWRVQEDTDDLMPMKGGSLLLGAPREGGRAVHWKKQIDPQGAHFWDQSRSSAVRIKYIFCSLWTHFGLISGWAVCA